MSLFGRFLLAVTAFLPPPRVIYALDGKSPYLSRWYLAGRPSMPDGSEPFNQYGNVREGAVWPPGGGVYLHRFHQSDAEPELHSHPFSEAYALVLSGGYVEERRIGDKVVRHTIRPGDINQLDSSDFHRVELLGSESWSIFSVKDKSASWGFWDRVTKTFTHHREFFAKRAAERAARAGVQANISVEITDEVKAQIDGAISEVREIVAAAAGPDYPGKGGPWADFLHHRGRALREAYLGGIEDVAKLARKFSTEPGQVAMILGHVGAHPELFPPEPAKAAKVGGGS